jgi:hypothetical protein
LGKKGLKEEGKSYDVRSSFPYELYETSRGPYFLFARIMEALVLLSYVALPILLGVKYFSTLQGYATSFLAGVVLSSLLFSLSYFFLTVVPASKEKFHLSLFFLSSAFNALNLSMEGLFLITLAKSTRDGTALYILAAFLFATALFSLALPMNPRLKKWAEMEKVAEADGTLSFRRPKIFILALSEWLLFALSLGGYFLALVGFFLVSIL